MNRATFLVATAISAAIGLSACGAAQQAVGSARPEAEQQKETATGMTLAAAEIAGLGNIVTDDEGRTLYRFDKDKAKPSKSTCDGECATAWPPALAEGDITAEGIDNSLIGTVDRADGTKQLTLNGWPLYRFAKDKNAGDAKGEGVGGTWFAAAPDGKKAAATKPDGIRLSATEIASVGQGVTDAKGYTLYRFDKDKAKPSKSTCDGDCATAWPPVLAGDSEVTLDGIDRTQLGTVIRTDGSKQLTLGGWPLYRYAKDKAPGEAKGQGVAGTWYAAAPDGKKAATPTTTSGY